MKTKKAVVNKCYGGFGVSKELYEELGLEWDDYGWPTNKDFGIESDDYLAYRYHKPFIKAIEKLGTEAASGETATLVIVKVPIGLKTRWILVSGWETILAISEKTVNGIRYEVHQIL